MVNTDQIILSFPDRVDMSLENYMILPTNHEAFLAVQRFPEKTGDVLAIYGNKGLGKTHLLEIYKNRTCAELFQSQNPQTTLNLTSEKHVFCDDLQTLNGDDQENLFHVCNHIKSFGGSLLVASEKPVSQLDILPDLKSRLLLAPQIEIQEPTDAHLEVLLVKMASDKQIYLEPKVVQYILKHASRNIRTFQSILNALDVRSLQHKRKITIPLVKEVL